jgi:hypothetical protein
MKKLAHSPKQRIYVMLCIVTLLAASGFIYYKYQSINGNLSESQKKVLRLSASEKKLQANIASVSAQLQQVTSEDQFVKNKKQQEEIKHIHDTYKQTVDTYEALLKLREAGGDTKKLDEKLAQSLSYLSNQNYASAEAVLTTIKTGIDTENQKLAQKATEFKIATNVAVNNAPPSSGFSRQKVQSDVGDFQVDIVSADMGSTRVVVDTASDNDCHDNCPVLPLGDYVAKNGAFAGINGSYFCPATYPSCAGKTNSFDLLIMNKNKHYFNSDNNVYSTNPVVVFGSGFVRFVGQGSGWGRDTGVDGVLMNYPMLVSGGQAVGSGGSDPKMGSKGPRGFVGNKGNTVYIGITYNATVGENAHVLKTLGLENALNLDSGGSTALWFGGYKAGPGRNIPNAILFIRK